MEKTNDYKRSSIELISSEKKKFFFSFHLESSFFKYFFHIKHFYGYEISLICIE